VAYSSICRATTSSAPRPPHQLRSGQLRGAAVASGTVPVTFAKAQAAGNLNVVVVGWNDTNASVTSVTDSKGNVYTRAVRSDHVAGTLSQSIYYAKNIVAAAAGTNVSDREIQCARGVSRTFESSSTAAWIQSIPWTKTALERYRGPCRAPAPSRRQTPTSVVRRQHRNGRHRWCRCWVHHACITVPDGDIAQDRVVATTASYSATARFSGGSWVIQMVAFKAAP
jgi:hypothetical protein